MATFKCNNHFCSHIVHDLPLDVNPFSCPRCGTTTYEGMMIKIEDMVELNRDGKKADFHNKVMSDLQNIVMSNESKNHEFQEERDRVNWERTILFELYKSRFATKDPDDYISNREYIKKSLEAECSLVMSVLFDKER